ncbi:hypothetical protein NEOLEDRAFT_704863 [Neolentinus lepideus HHB14362 ss-1]|uniref:Uncharacterized protein n=1 Tax=Neolentinus lepideus HHB14362 ss-1 TaxID=1314782 RepID=A0A165V5F7_9AGAM|nr:hypothetical protein NEOLEDRAFT_704863 [Neolentinus lepideus HHB14362 ss-1]
MSSSSSSHSSASSSARLTRIWIQKSVPPIPSRECDEDASQRNGYSRNVDPPDPYAIEERPRSPTSAYSQGSPVEMTCSPMSTHSTDSFEGDIRHPDLIAEEDNSTITFASPSSPDLYFSSSSPCAYFSSTDAPRTQGPSPSPLYIPPSDFLDRALLTPISEQTEIESDMEIDMDTLDLKGADVDLDLDKDVDLRDDCNSLAPPPSLSDSSTVSTVGTEVSYGRMVNKEPSCGSLSTASREASCVSTPATEASCGSLSREMYRSPKVLRRVDKKWYRPRELGLPGLEERDLLDSDYSDEEEYY